MTFDALRGYPSFLNEVMASANVRTSSKSAIITASNMGPMSVLGLSSCVQSSVSFFNVLKSSFSVFNSLMSSVEFLYLRNVRQISSL